MLTFSDRQVVEISKQPHANDHMLQVVKDKLCEVCKEHKLHDCEVQEGAIRKCFFQ